MILAPLGFYLLLYYLFKPRKVVVVLRIQPSPLTEYPVSGGTVQINLEFSASAAIYGSPHLTKVFIRTRALVNPFFSRYLFNCDPVMLPLHTDHEVGHHAVVVQSTSPCWLKLTCSSL